LKEEAPKGESQERCRCEIKPARDAKGGNRHEGKQTLKTEPSGPGKARDCGPSIPLCAVGKLSPREELMGCGSSARIRWVILQGR